MKKNLINNDTANKIVSKLATEKKKTLLALCLIILMSFMWIKVLAKSGPDSAGAAEIFHQVGLESQSNQEKSVSFIKLPEIAGRHDVIKRDFFDSNEWENFTNTNNDVVVTREVNVIPGDSTEKVIERIADNLRLEAFIMGSHPRAYINDKILSVGDILPVKDNAEIYECEVVLIENNCVVMKCGNAEVILKLKKVIENSD